MRTAKIPDESWRDSPVAWFCELDRARERHDFQRAAEAQRELERLGVRVKYLRPSQRKAVADAK